jgi:hypothetical protein
MNVDIAWVRVSLDGEVRDAPVWLPRPDVAVGAAGRYGAWGALCCGLQETLQYDIRPTGPEAALAITIILTDGTQLAARAPERLPFGQTVAVSI